MEDGALTGGFGSAVGETLLAREITSTRLLTFGWPDSYIPQGDITELRERFGLSANAIAGRISAVIRKQ